MERNDTALLNYMYSHGGLPEESFYQEGMAGELERQKIDPYGHKGIYKPKLKQKYGIQNPTFRQAYDTEISGLSFNPAGAILDQGLKAMGVELPSWMKAKAGDFLPAMALPEMATIAKQKYDEGDYASAIGHGAMAGLEGLAIGTAAKPVIKMIDDVAEMLPNTSVMGQMLDEFSGSAVMHGAGDAGNYSTMLGKGAKNFTKGHEAEYELYKEARKAGKLSDSKIEDATGFGTTPQGEPFRVVPDQDLALVPRATPTHAEVAAMRADVAIVEEWDRLRSADPLSSFQDFKKANKALFDRKQQAEWNAYDYYQKFHSTDAGKVGDNVIGSEVLANYPKVRDMNMVRMRGDVAEGHVTGNELMLNGEDVPVLGHELGHAGSRLEGRPRGGNSREMRDLRHDLGAVRDHKREAAQMAGEDFVRAADRGDFAGMDKWGKKAEAYRGERDALTEHMQVGDYDRYQSLQDERMSRYTQHGIENSLSADELRMFPYSDFNRGEKMRTGLDDLVVNQGDSVQVSDVMQGDIGGVNLKLPKNNTDDIVMGSSRRRSPDEVPTGVMNRRSNANKAKIAAKEKDVSDYRASYPPSQGWKPFGVAYSEKDGKLSWKATSDSGFDYHIDQTTGKEYTGIQLELKTEEMSDGMVRDYEDVFAGAARGDESAIETLDALEWYNKVRESNRDSFGSSAQVFGEFQGATSKNTGLPENMKMADELFHRYMQGDFEPVIDALQKHVDGGGTLKSFNPRPYIKKLANNKLFGMHTDDVMNVMLDNFRRQMAGKPAKIRNYAGNWTGSSRKATIDMWAARTAQRLLRPNHRVVPAWSAVSGINKPTTTGQTMVKAKELNARGIDVPMAPSGGYGMAENAMEQAVQKLKNKYPDRFANVTADDFQAFEWINEKDIWAKNQWGAPDIDANAIDILNEKPRDMYRTSISASTDADPMATGTSQMMRGLNEGIEGEGVHSLTRPTTGKYADFTPETAISHETYAPQGWNPDRLVANTAREGGNANQIDAMVSKRTDINNPNARAGFEAYFNEADAGQLLPAVRNIMSKYGVEASTNLQGVNRYMPKKSANLPDYPSIMPRIDSPVGIQSMFVPEISMRYNTELSGGITVAQVLNNPELIRLVSKTERTKFKKIAKELEQLKGIHFSKQYEYDTLHFGEGLGAGKDSYGKGLNLKYGDKTPESQFGAMGMEERLLRKYGR